MRTWLLGLALASVGTAAMAADDVQTTPVPAPAPAPGRPVEQVQPGDLTMARVFGSPELSGPQPRALKLSPDGSLLTFLRPRADEKERLDLWARDTGTGAERMLVDSKQVGSGAELTEAEKMQRERADRRVEGHRRL
jgi:dipeptidyl-peptidase-4